MALDLSGTDALLKKAVAHYWKTLDQQASKQKDGDADRGRRSSVTGGKQMDGFCTLIQHLLRNNGLKDGHIYLESKLGLPGFFRPRKEWDMLVLYDGTVLGRDEI